MNARPCDTGPVSRGKSAIKFAALATVSLLPLLGGCQVRPLYGTFYTPLGVAVAPVQDELAAIEIGTVKTADTVDLDRVAQVLRNELIFGFRRGGSGLPPRYRLEIILGKQQMEVGVERLADVPASYTVTMNASFVLSDYATGRTEMTGRSFATASYDFSSQRFANVRAERDAENRAAKVIATDIQARIAGHFAQKL